MVMHLLAAAVAAGANLQTHTPRCGPFRQRQTAKAIGRSRRIGALTEQGALFLRQMNIRAGCCPSIPIQSCQLAENDIPT